MITGGSRGLGLELAREFSRRGAKLFLCARDAAELERARTDLAADGARVWTSTCDVTRKAEVEALLAAATEQMGGVDVLVNVAGVIQIGPAEVMSEQDFQEAMDVNFWGLVHTSYGVLADMRARGEGRIVNITSIGGVVSVPHLLPYSASKFAAVGFSTGLAAELARYGIKVTTVAPGLMRTGSFLQAKAKGQPRKESSWFSLGASLPLMSMNSTRAARLIVDACVDGDRWATIGLQARLLQLAGALGPETMARVLSLVSRLMPGPGQARPSQHSTEGFRIRRGWLNSLATTLGHRAAAANNEIPSGS